DLDWPVFEQAIKQYSKELPSAAITDTRPGVGFIICHQGRGWQYLVFCWWDNENELPQKIFVRKIGKTEKWKPAAIGQAICVWDLEVIWFERNAYIATVMAGESVDEYLSRHFVQTAKV
ncbi:MAG TPA: isochorismatase, partial [candidate division Zixibacteria bacterium]|nr:isochorismatase [candidate division Zixibacteria bacterium]